MQITQIELNTLRTLAQEYAEIANLPVQRKKMELWKSFNRLDQTRPMVTITQIPWHELNYDGSLTCVCTDPFLKELETRLRQTIFQWKHFPADMVVEPFFTIPYCVTGNQRWGITADYDVRSTADGAVLSWDFHNIFEDEESINMIKDIKVDCDWETSKEWLDATKLIFDGIMPVRQAGGTDIPLQIWDGLSSFMHVDNLYYYLYDRPEWLHDVMERMVHSTISGIESANKLGLYDTSAQYCHCSGIYTDELLPDFGAGIGNDSYHSWSFAMAQPFTSVSPEITNEYEIHYVKQMAKYFGMLYYGCCERLDDRLQYIQEVPNIKKISCSPWSNKENFAYNLKKEIIMSNKPSPAYLAGVAFDADLVGGDLTETCEIAKKHGLNVEFLLKDISTVGWTPERLFQWEKIAMNIAENY